MAVEVIKVVNSTRNTVLGDSITVAQSSLSRLVGLLGRRGLEPGCGLLIVPSQAVHTVAMRFPIDVVFIDRDWRVTHLRPVMRPNRVTAIHWKSRFILELPAGAIAASSTAIGDQFLVE
jgi:uncharacterized membrane protein (UPF0127 family)